MDRIAEIKRIEDIAGKRDRVSSEDRWTEARLIWEEVQDGRTKTSIADEVGKSRTHISFMYNCWDRVGKRLNEMGSDTFPAFYGVYNSDEVRAAEPQEQAQQPQAERPIREQRDANTNPRKAGNDQREHRESASDWVDEADSAIRKLTDFPGFWPLMSAQDAARLRGMIPRIRTIAKGIEAKRQTTATRKR